MKTWIIIYDTNAGLSAETVENEEAGKQRLYKRALEEQKDMGPFDTLDQPDVPISEDERDQAINDWLGEDGRIEITEIDVPSPFEQLFYAQIEIDAHTADCQWAGDKDECAQCAELIAEVDRLYSLCKQQVRDEMRRRES